MLNKINNQTLLKYSSYIGGEWLESGSRSLDVIDPASLMPLAKVNTASLDYIQRAIEAAEKAFVTWKATPAKKRARILNTWFRLVMENSEDLAKLITLEQGKPIAEARAEIAYGASYIEWFAEQAKRINGSIIPATVEGQKIEVHKEPVGVVAAITPWNFPNAMLTRKIAPALAAGCTIVAKPAEETPLSALALAELSQQAGIPSGVVNIVVSDQAEEVGKLLCAHSSVRKLSFTGSTNVGKQLLTQCVNTLKKVSLELGGNAPLIVCEDANIRTAIEGALKAKFRNSGQTCISANRFLVHESICENFISVLREKIQKIKLGPGLIDTTVQGPLIHKDAQTKIDSLIKAAVEAGAKILVGGKPQTLPEWKGYFYQPTILLDVTKDMEIFNTEIFGPVISITTFSDDAQALSLANSTDAGLAAYVFTESFQRAHFYSSNLEFGMVGVNEGSISNEMAPFGGIKESGIGREGAEVGMDDYLQLKYICTCITPIE